MKYEYEVLSFDARGCFSRKVDTPEMEDELNRRGAEGWELVKVSEVLKDLGMTAMLVAIMKRERV